MNALNRFRGQEFVGVEELTDAAVWIEEQNLKTGGGSGAGRLTVRMARQYLKESLLGSPSGQAGSSLLFDYANLLRLLAVRRLLAGNWSIIKIREIMRTLDVAGLEKLVRTSLARPQKPGEETDAGTEHRHTALAPAHTFTTFSELSAEPPQPDIGRPAAAPRPPPSEREPSEWIEIIPGLEVKIRRSFRLPENSGELDEIRKRVWATIESIALKRGGPD